MADFKIGQKWISNAEPDLGMGRIIGTQHRLITIQFDLVDQIRTYAKEKAPLTRVQFGVGDQIRTSDNVEIIIESVVEKDGILIYQGDYQGTRTAIFETDLDPNVRFSSPADRLFTHQFDENRWFNLRYYTSQQRALRAGAPMHGLYGPRVALIPHQLFIAREVSHRYAPRVLLADEVGLGKTIEAGLIIHQQLMTERAGRVLVIVPPALTFQWFVEMIRRFNLQFTILDEERCKQIELDNQPEDEDDVADIDNPFDAQQLVLCSLGLFTGNETRLAQALDADWDLIVVDEAHHLKWQDGHPGADYLAVESLAQKARGLLLLTATPEQLGRLGHFSRLRLLDPSRYHDYDKFLEEENQFEEVAHLVHELTGTDTNLVVDAREAIRARLSYPDSSSDEELIRALLDQHGTGRVLFRNVRESVKGFPKRLLRTYELPPAPDYRMYPESKTWLADDPRIPWMTDLIAGAKNKFLVICAHQQTAISLERHLKEKTIVRSAVFHESLDLIARDRAANYFADTESGAQVLVCSEIGSEGRNFQFAHHLIMFDLPAGPDLLEQRIGRLDRIGQKEDVIVHVPFVPDSDQHRLLRWYDEGLGIFDGPNPVAQVLFEELSGDLDTGNVDELVTRTRDLSDTRRAMLKDGRDKLLELNSHRPAVSGFIIEEIDAWDKDDRLEYYMELSFDMFGLESEPVSDRIQTVKPTEGMVRHAPVSAETMDRFRYPELPDEGVTITYDRATALAREDVTYLTWENPMVQQAMDIVLSDTTGNCVVVVVKIPGVTRGTMLMETVHITECTGVGHMECERFLPPGITRSVVTPDLEDVSDDVPFGEWREHLAVPDETLQKIVTSQEAGLKKMLAFAQSRAETRSAPLKAAALKAMQRHYGEEVERLSALSRVNPNVRQEEVEHLRTRMTQLAAVIDNAQLRLDALRVLIAA